MTGAPLTETVYTADAWWNSLFVSDERIRAQKGGKYGYLNLSGDEVIPFIYDDATPFGDGMARVCQEEKWGVIDLNGGTVIPIEFDYMRAFINNLAVVVKNEKWGLIDKTGTFVFPMEYDQITAYKNGFITATKEGKTILTDVSRQSLFAGEYFHINPGDSDHIGVGRVINGLSVYGLADANETLRIGWKDFTFSALSERLYLGKKTGNYPGVAPPHDYAQRFALLDAGGDNLTGFKYGNVRDFFNDYLVVSRYYDEGAGLLNQYGAEVLPTIFDSISLTDEGYVFIQIHDGDGENNYNKTYAGYFKIPDSFSDRQNIRPITVYLDGVELLLEPPPMMANERIMVPLRKIFETMGLAVDWDVVAGTASFSGGGKNLRLTAGSGTAYVNGAEIRLDAAPVIEGNTLFAPLRFVSEISGAKVEWLADLRRVVITQPQSADSRSD
jgi:hypothetical protein